MAFKVTHSYTQKEIYSNDFHYGHYMDNDFSSLRPQKPKQNRKKSFIQLLISGLLLFFIVRYGMTFSFNTVTKAIFIPTPYKNIQVDMMDFAFPTRNYLSNSWVLGKRLFSLHETRNPQMINLKENVNMPVLHSGLLNLIENYPEIKPAIYVWDYTTQNYIDINASKIYSTASIIKIPVLIELFKTIELGDVSLNDKIPLTEYYRSEGSGSLQFKAHNSQYTIDELAYRMITESDNSATNMLMSKIGSMTDVNRAIRDWGLKNTEVKAWLPDLDGYNHTTAKEMAQMLYNIDENDNFLSESSRSRMLNYMGHVHNNRLIQAGLGNGSIFLHKTGDIGSMLGDAGIVIPPNGKKYIVVILANRPHNSYVAKDFIINASKIIYDYMVE